MADWWARRIGGGLEDVSVLDTAEEDLVTDTLTAFRESLRQAEDADSAADLTVQERDRTPLSEEASLDYFAPAFRQVLGGEEATKDSEALEGTRRDEGKGDVRSDSLDYFTPAFHRVLGEDDGAPAASSAEVPPKTDEDASLDYFAPAFRRALGDEKSPTTETDDRRLSADAQKAVLRFKEAMRNVSHRARLEVPGFVCPTFSLDRIADSLFGAKSRDLVVRGG